MTPDANDIAAAIAGDKWQSYRNTSIRHGDRSESEVHTRPVAGHSWKNILVWRVMYRAPHDKRQSRSMWPRQKVIACGFAFNPADADQAAKAAMKANSC